MPRRKIADLGGAPETRMLNGPRAPDRLLALVDFDGERTEAGFVKFLEANVAGSAEAAAKDEL